MSQSKEIQSAFGGADNMPANFNPQALMKSTAALPKTSNKPFLSFRDGEWTFGADHAEVEEGSLWAVNPNSFMFGLIEWCDSKAGAELMVPAGTKYSAEDLNLQFDPDDEDHRIAPQVSIDLYCVTGDDEGLEVNFKTSTRGGTDVINDLAIKIAKQAASNPDQPVAIISLEESSYRHKKYGKKYVPIFKLEDFDDYEFSATRASSDGKKTKSNPKKLAKAETPEKDDAVEEDHKPASRRRRSRK